jgi:indolepyruvate decarboxylase
MIVFVGDGSFQETCQAMSSHTRHKQNNIVFIMNNQDFYGIEQMLVDARAYVPKGEEGRENCHISPDFYNELQPWNYTKLAEVFGNGETKMHGHRIETYADLKILLAKLSNPDHEINDGPNIVQVRLPKMDYPSSIGYKVRGACNTELPSPCDALKEELLDALTNSY